MDSNPNDEALRSGRIEAAEDVEGHAARFKGIDGPDADDVEGHRFYNSDKSIKDDIEPVAWKDSGEGDDVEGHASRFGLVEDEDDTEGHGTMRGGIVEPEPQDVEGHVMKARVIEDESDVEGHGVRVKILDADQPTDEDGDTEGHGLRGHIDGPDTEDVEGHRVSRVTGDDDVEGHGAYSGR